MAKRKVETQDWGRQIIFRGKKYYYWSEDSAGLAKKEARKLMKAGYSIRLVKGGYGIGLAIYVRPNPYK